MCNKSNVFSTYCSTIFITLSQKSGFNKKLCGLPISWHSFLRNLDEKINEYNNSIYEKTL